MEKNKVIEKILHRNVIKINNDDLIRLTEQYKEEHNGKEPNWVVEVPEGGKAKGKKNTLMIEGEEEEEGTCYVVGKVRIIGEEQKENEIIKLVEENTVEEERKQERHDNQKQEEEKTGKEEEKEKEKEKEDGHSLVAIPIAIAILRLCSIRFHI